VLSVRRTLQCAVARRATLVAAQSQRRPAMTLGRILSRRLALAALCGTLFVSSAASAAKKPPMSPPRVALIGIEALPAVSAANQRYRVNFLLDNQNTEPLGLKEVRFTVRLLGLGVLVGHSLGEVTIEGLDQHTVKVEVPGDTLPSYSQLIANAGPGDKLDYELYGNITLSKGIKKTVPIQGQGVVKLSKVKDEPEAP
jgi:hypothetical protein